MSEETKKELSEPSIKDSNKIDELVDAVSSATSDEVQEAMLANAEEAAQDTFGMAAKVYDHLKYRSREQINSFKSLKRLKKLMLALLEYPIQDHDTYFKDDFEKDSFHVCNALMEAKYVMLFHHNMEVATEKQKADAEEAAAEQKHNNKEK